MPRTSRVVAGLILIVLLAIVPTMAFPAPATPGPTRGPQILSTGPEIPFIDTNPPPSYGLNIGPGWPAALVKGMNFTVILREPINGTVRHVYLIAVKLVDGHLNLIKSETAFLQINSTAIKLIDPATSVGPGLYDLMINTTSGESILIPRSIWVVDVNKLASDLIFQHISDVHFGAGTPNITIGQYRRYVGYLMSQLLGVDMIINTGDEADTASANQYANSLAYRYDFAYNVPMYMNPGNHDYPNRNFIRYYGDTVRYMVIAGRILIIALNTDGEVGHADQANLTFLENVLKEYKDIPIKILIFHHPVFYYQGKLFLSYDSNSSLLQDPNENKRSALSFYWGADMNATREILRLIEEYNVTMVLAGHIHRDQYVEYHSTRTGHVTYFQTTTTLAHGTGTYQGFQVVNLNLSSGVPSYPYAPSWFIGYKNHSRKDVYNSIPLTLPKYAGNWKDSFGNNYLYGDIHQGRTAIIMSLYNYMNNININKTVIVSFPWPEGYDPNIKIVKSENGSIRIVDYIYCKELHRIYIALHYNMPPKSMVKFALYTERDNEPPLIELKRILPRNPSINRDIKAYITVSDNGWGIESVTANATVDRGNITKFEFKKFGEATYIAQFKVSSQYATNVTIHVTSIDYAGNRNTTTITIHLSGPMPPASPGTTTSTTQTSQSTSPAQTTGSGAQGGSGLSTGTGAGQGNTGSAQASEESGNNKAIIIVIITIVVIIIGLYMIRK